VVHHRRPGPAVRTGNLRRGAGERAHLTAAVATWAARHPSPAFRAFAFADTTPFSAAELAEALAGGTGTMTRQFYRMVAYALEEAEFDEIVTSFEQAGTLPPPSGVIST